MYEYQGLVFEDFTRSKTFLIPKNGNPTDYNNYRSISRLTHASKKLQQIIKIGLKEKLKKWSAIIKLISGVDLKPEK